MNIQLLIIFYILSYKTVKACNYYLNFQGNCINDCSSIGAINPSIIGEYCKCPTSAPYVDEQKSGCIYQCPHYIHLDTRNFKLCIYKCVDSIANSSSPQTIGDYCLCIGGYFNLSSSSCVNQCPLYLNLTGDGCIDDCQLIKNAEKPSQLNNKCLCIQNTTIIDGFNCSDNIICYKHIDDGNSGCITSCPDYIPNSVNPSQYGQKCICPSSHSYMSISKNECISSCPQNSLSSNGVCKCSNSPYLLINESKNDCVSSCPNYTSIDGTQCINYCPYYKHPNPSIKKCFSDCTKIQFASNPLPGESYCRCSNIQYPFFNNSSDDSSQSCVSSCPNYYFYNYCLDDCSSIQNLQKSNIQNIKECICPQTAPYKDSNTFQCYNVCPLYAHLDIRKFECVNNCSVFQNSDNSSANGRCICGNSLFPYISNTGDQCISSCGDGFQTLNSSTKMCTNNCSSEYPGSENPLFSGYQCKCPDNYPYKSIDQMQCLNTCPTNQSFENGECKCSGTTPYLNEFGTDCVSSCSYYIHPNPAIKQCVVDCSKISNFQNPTNKGSKCICKYPDQYIRSDYSKCESFCDQQFIHSSTEFDLCVKDCPSSIPGTVNPAKYMQRCICKDSKPYFKSDNSGCIETCPDYKHLNPNIKQCVSDCTLLGYSNPSSIGESCICGSIKFKFMNESLPTCVSSCPQYSSESSGLCTCTLGYNNSTKSCNVDATTPSPTSNTFQQILQNNIIILLLIFI